MSESPSEARILYVGADSAGAEGLASCDRFAVDVLSDAGAVIERVLECEYDCLVCEYELEGTTGVELATAVDEERPTLPVVLSPERGSEAIAGEAVSAPVTEYVAASDDVSRPEQLATTVETLITERRSGPDRRRLREAVESTADGIALLDSEGRYEYVNRAYAEIYGYEPDELVGHHKDAVYPAAQSFDDIRSEVRDEGQLQREGQAVRADGTEIWVQYTVSTTADGGFVCTSRELSEQQRRQEELERQSSLLDSLFDQIPAHLYIKDTEGRHLRMSRYFVDRGGVDDDVLSIESFDREHVIGKTDIEINDMEYSRQAHEDDMHVIETGEPIMNKQEHVEDNDEWNLTSKVPWRDEDGTIRGVIGITQRITEQKQVEAELERKNERLAEFASLVSHDLRNPLQTARGRTEILQRRYDDDNLAVIQRAHDRMETLVDDILTLARGGEESLDRESVALGDVIDQCWDRVDTDDASLVVETDQTVFADRTRLAQLLENLFQNAVDHGGAGVTVTIGDLPKGGFYVEDDGSGIQVDDRAEVFDAGFSTDDDGTGFGLRIVQQVVEEHGWTVDLTEDSTGGARFEVCIDLSADP